MKSTYLFYEAMTHLTELEIISIRQGFYLRWANKIALACATFLRR